MALIKLINIFKKYISTPKKVTSTDHIYKTQLKKQTLSDYLLAQTACDYLIQLKTELEKEFHQKQSAGSSIKHHSDEHIILIANLHRIQNNITKVISEIQCVNKDLNEISSILRTEINLEKERAK